MIYSALTRNGNTMIRASYPYGRGNSQDRYLFAGRELFDRLSSMDRATVSDLPHHLQAVRVYHAPHTV